MSAGNCFVVFDGVFWVLVMGLGSCVLENVSV